jgi:hypothetical protein
MKRGSDPEVGLSPPSGEEQEGFPVSPSTEAWIERMIRAGERMHRDEDYRREIAKRLS